MAKTATTSKKRHVYAVISCDARQAWIAVPLPYARAVALARQCAAAAVPVRLCASGLHYEKIDNAPCPCSEKSHVPDKRTLYRTAIIADDTLDTGELHNAFARGTCVAIVGYRAYNDSYDIMSQGRLRCNVAPECLAQCVL